VGIFTNDGTRVTKSGVPLTDIDPLDVPKELTEDLYSTRSYGQTDPKPEGSVRSLLARAGAVFTQRELNRLFPPVSVSEVSPASGPAVGGTVVTITGESLDGVTAVNFGGTAGTNLEVVSDTEVNVTTPAGVAGAVDVEVVDDSGSATETGGYTYV
jgi:hypothetical protein